jgi:hypothetical protein
MRKLFVWSFVGSCFSLLPGCVDEALVALAGEAFEGCWHAADVSPEGEEHAVHAPALAFGPDGSPWIVQNVQTERSVAVQLLSSTGGEWAARTVLFEAQSTVTGGGGAIAFDPGGAVHVAAPPPPAAQVMPDGTRTIDAFDLPLLELVPQGADWSSTEIAAAPAGTDGTPPFAIDAAGTARLAYTQSLEDETLSRRLWLATRVPGGSWESELVHEGHVRGVTLALAPDGAPHIAFVDICPDQVREDGCLTEPGEGPSVGEVIHTWRDAKGWLRESVAHDANWQVAADHWIAFDSIGHIHVGYAGDGVLRHAFRTNAGWQSEDAGVLEMIDGRADVAMALGPDDTIHLVVAHEARPKRLWYGGRDGRWTVEGVDGETGVDRVHLPSLAVRPDGTPCMAYATDGGSRYACRCEAP